MQHLAAIDIKDSFFTQPGHLGAERLSNTPESLVSQFLPTVIVVAGVICFVIIIISGYQILSAAGSQSSPQAIAKNKSTLTMAIIGLLIIATAYFILQIIGRTFGIDLTNIDSSKL